MNSGKERCLECGLFDYLTKCTAHCEKYLCESCKNNHWQREIDELMNLKGHLEANVNEMKNYLNSKKVQCQQNVQSSAQIKKFITMAMQQIKRKVELELENKRDELFNSIDTFVENQKRISQSINDDTFQTSDRICKEIDNVILNSE